MNRKFFFYIFFLLVLLPASAQVTSVNTTIFWDTSLSMKTRDLDKDLGILQKIFKRTPNQKVQLVLLNNTAEEEEFTITSGDWSTLKTVLTQQSYDGAANYSLLEGMAKNPKVYFFTDGIKVLANDYLSLPEKSFIINSNPNSDTQFLKQAALISRSRLMDFTANFVKNKGSVESVINTSDQVKGTIYVDNKPAINVKVVVKGTAEGVLTDANGQFAISAKQGDSLVITSREKSTFKIMAISEITNLDIFLKGNIVALDEVILVENQQEATLVVTGYGTENKEKLGYNVTTLGEDRIAAVEVTAEEVLANKVAGLDVRPQEELGTQGGGLGRAVIRGGRTINASEFALVVIDNVPQQRSANFFGSQNVSEFNFIDPNNIAEITVLKSLAATNRFGSEGSNGAILITTKTGKYDGAKAKKGDRALLKNNIYTEDQSASLNVETPLVRALNASKSLEEAYDTYITLRNFNSTSSEFYLNAFNYFHTKDKTKAAMILSNIIEIYPNDLAKLRAVSLSLWKIEAYDAILTLSNHIIKKYPTEVQTYLDRALVYKAQKDYQKAFKELLALYKGSGNSGLQTKGVLKTIEREIRNLVSSHPNAINTFGLEDKLLNAIKFKVRAVFQWSDPSAEFNIQFVNPQNRFFNWEHNNTANADRIQEEITEGYANEEFEFYGDINGKWIINIAAEAAQKDYANPLVMKCSLYKNFGYSNQQHEEIVVAFPREGGKIKIKTLEVN